MQKIVLISAVAASLLSAEQVTQDSLAQMLEEKKVKKVETSSYMPDISLILDASYTHQSWDEDGHTDHLEIPGFVHGGGHDHDGHSHTSLAGEDGFNFNYAELAIGASVDNYFDMKAIFHITEDDFEVEEAFVTTTTLPYHLQLKLGKFKSDFGYLNNKHHHNYNFNEIPLVYNALLGDHGLTEQGFQLQYVVPAEQYIMVGLEAFKGDNERSFGYEGFTLEESAHDHDEHEEEHDEHEGEEHSQEIEDNDFPSLWVAYAKTSFDIGGGTLLAGVSMAQGDSLMNHLEDEESAHAYSGENTLYGVDLTYKYYFAADHAITWQSEYMYREMDGAKYVQDAEGEWQDVALNKEQSGYYTELVYQYDRNYRAGLRYSALNQNDISANGNAQNMPDDMYVTSVMAEYNPSEFSRIRLQYNYNSSLYDEDGEKNNKNEIILQFNYAIGAHGAHSF
ncbi:hypothetical protein [Sulfurovum sp.]|uniref:hypothetical protein n=1 Tax=Sulfurovum sp. TaxID=1969726 RepID=UPI002867D177|nr:hypothetical protein [Sulfurovum sp.]